MLQNCRIVILSLFVLKTMPWMHFIYCIPYVFFAFFTAHLFYWVCVCVFVRIRQNDKNNEFGPLAASLLFSYSNGFCRLKSLSKVIKTPSNIAKIEWRENWTAKHYHGISRLKANASKYVYVLCCFCLFFSLLFVCSKVHFIVNCSASGNLPIKYLLENFQTRNYRIIVESVCEAHVIIMIYWCKRFYF